MKETTGCRHGVRRPGMMLLLVLMSWAAVVSGPPAAAADLASGAGSPPPHRVGHAAIHDQARNRMIVWGGTDGADHDDLWMLALSGGPVWTRLTPSGASPSARHGHTAVFDSLHDRVIVFGGWNGSRYENDVWELSLSDPPTWNLRTPVGKRPSARYGHTAVLDPARNRIVVYGGQDETGACADAWALSLAGGMEWSVMTPGGKSPAARHGHAAIYDPSQDRMVMFGGYDRVGGSQNDVWALTFNGSTAWQELAPAGKKPSMRRDHTATYDPIRNRMVLFGGYFNYFSLADTWALSLSGQPVWTPIKTGPPSPSGRDGQTAIYDGSADRVLVHGGHDARVGAEDDTWALSLAGSPAWSLLTPPPAPPRRHFSYEAGLDAGAGMLTGTLTGDDVQLGLRLGASLDHLFAKWIALGLDASYNRFEFEGDFGYSSTLQYGLHGRFIVPTGKRFGLWGIVGLGGYSNQQKDTFFDVNGNKVTVTDGFGYPKPYTRPGYRLGGGVALAVSERWSVTLSGDYHFVLYDDDPVTWLDYNGVRLGVLMRRP